MSRILLVNQYYWPDIASTGQHLTDLAESLSEAGHEVSVVCSRGRYFEGVGTAPARETRNGVDVRRLRATSFGKGRTLGRLVDYLTFHLLALLALTFRPRADVIVTLTTPPLLGVVGWWVARLRGSKHVCFVMDLHPDAEFAAGMLRRDSLPGRLLEAVSRGHMRGADRCVVLGGGQERLLLDKGVAPERITTIPVWSDAREIEPLAHTDNPLRKELAFDGRFVVMYSGNAGFAHTFDDVLEAARTLADSDPEFLFVFVGGGPRTEEVREFAREHGLANVIFRPYFPREQLRYSLTAADVHLVTLRDEFRGVAVPGKLYGILASGRPVVFVGPEDSSSAQTVLESRAGSTVAIGQTQELIDSLRRMASSEEARWKAGRAGRAYFLRVHERERCCEMWRETLEDVCGVRAESGRILTDPRLGGVSHRATGS